MRPYATILKYGEKKVNEVNEIYEVYEVNEIYEVYEVNEIYLCKLPQSHQNPEILKPLLALPKIRVF